MTEYYIYIYIYINQKLTRNKDRTTSFQLTKELAMKNCETVEI